MSQFGGLLREKSTSPEKLGYRMARPYQNQILAVVLFVAFGIVSATPVNSKPQVNELSARTGDSSEADSTTPATDARSFIAPVRVTKETQGVDWGHLIGQSLFFLGIENAFRCATEDGTREGFSNPFFRGYLNSVGNLHGWNDGDPFIVNYVGHPMQGAVSGYLWTQNDRAYRDIQFGQNRKYWKGKLRGAAYSYVYSVLFEIGPMSEASIGNIQSQYPQQGFVDHVVTPVIGLGWSITEDALDQYFIRYVERRTANRWTRLLIRSGLNPSRSMANVLALKRPWNRDNRPGVSSPQLQDSDFMDLQNAHRTASREVSPPVGVAPFEFTLTTKVRTFLGDGHGSPCIGGGGAGSIRLASEWQFVVDVSGCKMLGLQDNFSGDSLTYLAGTRWTAHPAGRWTPHLEVLLGGTKLTQELIYPQLKKEILAAATPSDNTNQLYLQYSKHWETNGFTIQAGTGLDVKLNNALSYRVANLEYFHSWNSELNGIRYQNGLQFTSGLVLRIGTW
jgi:hypothetical protein